MKKSMLGALVVVMFVAVGIAAAPPLTFTFSDVHANKTAMETDSFAVNNAGMIAGDYVDAKSVQHAMILAGKKLTTVNHEDCVTSGGFTSGAIAFYGINKAGAAAGWCTSTTTVPVHGVCVLRPESSLRSISRSQMEPRPWESMTTEMLWARTSTPRASSMAS